ncbi:MAG: alpha-L-fucosidase [Planctomycetota bacterium]
MFNHDRIPFSEKHVCIIYIRKIQNWEPCQPCFNNNQGYTQHTTANKDYLAMKTKKVTLNKKETWFKKARFGVFIHWGLYSIPAVGEWTLLNQHIPFEEYRKLADRFNPQPFTPGSWAKLARKAGAQYMVFTTRHHDGFSLFDSKVSEFTSAKTAAGRDFVAEYCKACRAEGLKVGLYYSLTDWRFPTHRQGKLVRKPMEQMKTYVKEQIRELCTNYGNIDILWYDGPFGLDEKGITWKQKWPNWNGRELNRMVKKLQPHIAINDRACVPGDFVTCEQTIDPASTGQLWEACMTMNDNWGYHKNDDHWKPTWLLIKNLVECTSKGGSYLLNLGPRADGSIPEPSILRMRQIGRWLKKYREAIFGTARSELDPAYISFMRFSTKGNVRYMFEPCWPGSLERIRNFPYKVLSAQILGTKTRLKIHQKKQTVILTGLPQKPPNPWMSVIKLRVKT